MRRRPSARAGKDVRTAASAILMLVNLAGVLILPGCGDQSAPGEIGSLNGTNKAMPDRKAEKRTSAERTADKTSGHKSAADGTATAASDRAADNQPITGYTDSSARAAEIARMQEQKLTSIDIRKTAAMEVAGDGTKNATALPGPDKAGQAIAGFTYSDERALEMRTSLANIRNRRSDIVIVNEHGQLLNAFGQAVGDFFAHTLQNGEVIMIPEGGFEEKFLSALGSEAGPGAKVYILDRIFFTTGSVALDRESTDQIASIAAILRAYRNLAILIRGHTDNRGSRDANMELSRARADAVKQALVELGIDATRLQITGAGSAEPHGSNETPEGRRMNRRIDITVM